MADREFAEVDAPEKTRCPDCGTVPTEESVRDKQLSDLGYLHQDTFFECESCSREWTCGVPIGSSDTYAEELFCKACQDSWYRVHRVKVNPVESGPGGTFHLHLKCPNCYDFERIDREVDNRGIALVGWPQITGEMDGCENYGYPAGEG
jgi:uncharacterized protein with PIN domain